MSNRDNFVDLLQIWASSLAELNQECRTQHRKASYRTLTPIPTLQSEHHWTDPAYRESQGQLAFIVHEVSTLTPTPFSTVPMRTQSTSWALDFPTLPNYKAL